MLEKIGLVRADVIEAYVLDPNHFVKGAVPDSYMYLGAYSDKRSADHILARDHMDFFYDAQRHSVYTVLIVDGRLLESIINCGSRKIRRQRVAVGYEIERV